LIQLPSLWGVPDSAEHHLEDWLHPNVAFGEAEIAGTWADDHVMLLVIFAITASLLGILLGWLIYQKKRIKAWEPTLFANGWYYNWAVTWFMGNPGREGFEDVAVFDSKVIDGAVNGVGVAVREAATQEKRAQSGYLRQYAGIIGIGAVLLLGWFVIVRGIL
jgi:NADH-quinone oxidoreductase subunit L